jgi:gamma-glutamylcyclotransferase (GGCT)/AIG2-like uncharacterized protein YtfP
MPHTETRLPPKDSRHSGQQDRLSVGPEILFVYGSLLFPEVLTALLNRVPAHEPAEADGWRVAALPNRVYPGLVSGHGSTSGLLLTDLTAEEWRIVDAFEDPLYELRQLKLAHDGLGWTYVCNPEAEVLTDDWDPDVFAARDLATYVGRCAAWRRNYDVSRS